MVGEYSERRVKELLEQEGWLVAGSPGTADLDLVAVHPKHGGVGVEVKSTMREERFYLTRSQHRKSQAREVMQLSAEGYPVWYVVHFKAGPRADRFRVYSPSTLDDSPLRRSAGRPLGAVLEGLS